MAVAAKNAETSDAQGGTFEMMIPNPHWPQFLILNSYLLPAYIRKGG